MNRFAGASAVASLAFFAAVYAVDGIALKQAVDAWVSAPASQQSACFAVAQGMRGLEWAVRGYSDYITGLSFVLFGTVIASMARIPRPIGYVMGFSGLGLIARGYLYGTLNCDATCPATNAISNFPVLPSILLWVILLVISA